MKKYFQTVKEYAGIGGKIGKHSAWRMKFLKTAMCVLIAAGMTVVDGCDGDSDKEQGKEAAADFCNCFKTKSKDSCLDELKDNYTLSTYTSNDFIDAFNSAQTCNVKLERIQWSASSNEKPFANADVELKIKN